MVKDVLIVAGVVGLLYLVCRKTMPQQVPTLTPPAPVPFAPRIGGQVVIGDSYGVPPWGTVLATPGASSPTGLPSTVNPPPGFPPPGAIVGGIFGGVGTGGAPLGGPLTPGVSTGTGTTARYDAFGRLMNYTGGNPGGYN